MKRLRILACLSSKDKSIEETPVEAQLEEVQVREDCSPVVRTIGWISVAAGMIALGYFVGRQLRARYNFRRRTPYDFYSHAGDERNNGSAEYGVGI